MKKPGILLAIVAVGTLGLACPATFAGDNCFKGSVNSSGMILDPTGKTVGHVVISTGIPFDVNVMTFNPQGAVLDASGVVIGKVIFDDGKVIDQSVVLEKTVAAPVTVEKQVIVQPAQTQVLETELLPKTVVAGVSVDDLATRRAKVDAEITSALANGKLTESQAGELKAELADSVDREAKFKRDGVLKDREIISIYHSMDKTMSHLDRYLNRNSRDSAGLRSK